MTHDHLTLKEKLSYVLLSCLSYGCKLGCNEEQIRKRLKVEHNFDYKRIRSCLDLIQDTEGAIRVFAEYGLQKHSAGNIKGDGELYLRLYGILNAIYLQINTIIELYDVLKILNSQKKEVVKQFKSLSIFDIRNIVAAHTTNYLDEADYMPKGVSSNFFRITQMQLDARCESMHAVDGFGNVREYNLYESFLEYNKVSEIILFEGVISYFRQIIKSEKRIHETLNHYKLETFYHFDYRKMYKNDMLSKRYFSKMMKKLEKDMKKDGISRINILDDEVLLNLINELRPPF